MKFTCEKALLAEAIGMTAWAVSGNSSIPVLQGLLLEAGETLSLTGYNLETGIQTHVSAEILQPGRIVLNAKLFGDMIRLFPDDVVTVSTDGTNLTTVSCCNAKYEIMGFSADEYPSLPEVENEHSFALAQGKLKSMIDQTIFAISTNDNKPIHTGSLFEVEDNLLKIVSVDGFRLAIRTEEIEKPVSAPFSFVVPGHTLKEVMKLMEDSDESVVITLGKKHITFTVEDTLIISRVLEGEFLNYKNALPKTYAFKTSVSTREIISSIERVSILINERIKNPIRLVFDDASIHMYCSTPLGKSQDECPLTSGAEALEIGFNNRYLLDAFKACPDMEVSLELNTHLSPIVIKPTDGESYLYLILPVRLKADGETWS